MRRDEVLVERQSEAGAVVQGNLNFHDPEWGIVEFRPDLIRLGVPAGGCARIRATAFSLSLHTLQ